MSDALGALRVDVKVTDLVTLPSVAERMAQPARADVVVKAKLVWLEPDGITTEAGTRSATLLDFRLIVVFPFTARSMATVHAPVAIGYIAVGLQASEDRWAEVDDVRERSNERETS
jgi:hypothetical protein